MVDNRFYYNAPSLELIVKRIKKLVGESYSLDEFLQYDSDAEVRYIKKSVVSTAWLASSPGSNTKTPTNLQ